MHFNKSSGEMWIIQRFGLEKMRIEEMICSTAKRPLDVSKLVEDDRLYLLKETMD